MLLVRNLQTGPTVFSDKTTETAIEWAARDDANGDDVQQVPDALATENINFVRALRRGIFEVIQADDATQTLLDRQTEAWKERQDAGAKVATDSIDLAANNDIVTVACIGPNNRGTGECGSPVNVRDKQQGDHPPLCATHESLASSYAIVQDGTIVDGKAVQTWARSTMEPRERQQIQ